MEVLHLYVEVLCDIVVLEYGNDVVLAFVNHNHYQEVLFHFGRARG